jgi:amicoumacin kinase
MDPKIESLFNPKILEAACQRYSIKPGEIKLLDGFESFIYEFKQENGEFILRIGHNSRRSIKMIHGEVEWINYLFEHGVGVSRAVLSTFQNLVEPIDDGHSGRFLCTAFEKAPGGPATRDQINDQLFISYGRLLGQMHQLAKSYSPSNPAWKRYAWDGPENNTPDRQLGINELKIREIYQSLFSYLQTLPKDVDGYGLIHQDAHLGNLFVDHDYTITLFDFDDCVYGHFIYDIAMVLSYIVYGKEDPHEFTRYFLKVFFKGYEEFNHLDPKWLKEIPYFLKLREIDLFAQILFSMGEDPDDAWCKRYMLNRRERIENNVPFINFDFNSLVINS